MELVMICKFILQKPRNGIVGATLWRKGDGSGPCAGNGPITITCLCGTSDPHGSVPTC